jgi:hypothetical protein
MKLSNHESATMENDRCASLNMAALPKWAISLIGSVTILIQLFFATFAVKSSF